MKNTNQTFTSFRDSPYFKYWESVQAFTKSKGHLIVVLLLIILITSTFADMTWELFSSTQPASPKVLATGNMQTSSSKTSATSLDLHSLVDLHLFGKAQTKAPISQKVIEAPETRMRLTLKGVFASVTKSLAIAIIADAKGEDKTYRIGDKILGKAELHAVYKDRVILKQNGRLETLRLPKPKMSSSAVTKSARATATGNSPYDEKVANQLTEIRKTLSTDPSKIWQQVRINPIMKDGAIIGYTLDHNDQKLMKALGLSKTDVITSINGMPLNDPSTLYNLMGELSKQSIIDLIVDRDGQQQAIQITF